MKRVRIIVHIKYISMKSKDQQLLEQAYSSIKEGGMPPTAGAASRANANPGIHDPLTGELISPEKLKAAQHILDAYSKGQMSAEEVLKALIELK